jgi:hypothetical protein
LVGGLSFKAALELNWDDPCARKKPLHPLLDALTAVEDWLDSQLELMVSLRVPASSAVAHQVWAQGLTTTPRKRALL